MGLMKTLGAVTRSRASSLKKRFTKPPERVDKNAPLGLKIGNTIRLGTIVAMTAAKEFPKLQLELPSEPLYIRFYGVISDAGHTVHRFYLSLSVTDTEPAWMLQVVTDDTNDQVVADEIRLFQEQSEITPEDDEEWLFWLDDDIDQFSQIGHAVFEDAEANNLVYQRDEMYGSLDKDQIKPLLFHEKVYADVFGENVSHVRHRCMFYGRISSKYDDEEPPEDFSIEWCLISVIKTGDGEWVQIFKGLNFKSADLLVNR